MARSKTVAFVAILALTTVGTLATASAQQSDISHLGEKMLQYQDSKIVVVPRGGLK
jgi:hypothetical protein